MKKFEGKISRFKGPTNLTPFDRWARAILVQRGLCCVKDDKGSALIPLPEFAAEGIKADTARKEGLVPAQPDLLAMDLELEAILAAARPDPRIQDYFREALRGYSANRLREVFFQLEIAQIPSSWKVNHSYFGNSD